MKITLRHSPAVGQWPTLIAALCGGLGCSMGSAAHDDASSDRGMRDVTAGERDADGAIEPGLSAKVVGMINGSAFDATSTLFGFNDVYVFVGTNIEAHHQEITITDYEDSCANTNRVGKTLYLDVFQDPSLLDASVKGPGTFTIWAPPLSGPVLTGDYPSTKNVAIVTDYEMAAKADSSGAIGRGFIAQSGTVTVAAVSAAEISGTFDVTFQVGDIQAETPIYEKQRLTGEFRAPHCKDWNRGSSIPAPP